MKKIYFAFCGLSMLFAAQASAQCTVAISSTSNDTVCAGTTVTLTAQTIGPGSALTSTFAAGNNHRGNMFDIHAFNSLTIMSFDAHPMGNTTIEIYYRPTPYAGFHSTSAGWILVGSAAVTAQPMGNPTPVPVPVNVTIPAGQTYSFYVTSSNQSVSLNYTDGSSEGAPYASNADLEFRQGIGLEYPFTNGTGISYTPRVWNGVIHYSLPGSATYAWSTGGSGSTDSGDVNSDTTFIVEANHPGCPVMYDTVHFTAAMPVADGGADVPLCMGDSVALYGAATGFGPFVYAWDNAVDGVMFAPAATGDYILSATDYLGCTDEDTVTIEVDALPVVMAGNDTTVCAGSMLTLSGAGAANYAWDGGITDGVPFAVNMSMTYEVIGTDSNGCVDNDSVTVTSHSVNVATTTVNETITAADTAAVSYQWIDCNTLQPIAGETNYWFTATVNGSYAVVITDSICSDTSACEVILSTGIASHAGQVVSLYPNPTNGTFFLNTGSVAQRVELLDVTGRSFLVLEPQSAQLHLSLENAAAGQYFVRVAFADGSVEVLKIAKQ